MSNKKALARKAMHSPLFSKEAVRRSEHLITDMVAKFLAKLSGYASGTMPVDLTVGFCCITADVAMNYGFQRPFNVLDAEGFQSELINSAEALLPFFLWSKYFPRVFGGVSRVAARLPRWFMSRFMKPFALVNWCLDVSLTCPLQCGLMDPLAHDDVNRYLVSKLYTYKSALLPNGIFVRCSISIFTPISRKANSHLRLER